MASQAWWRSPWPADEGVEFALEQPSVLVQPKASAQVALSFSPKEAGPRQAILHVEAEAERQTVRLQGIGQFFALSPATVDFGRIAVGESSSRVIEIANVGNADFEIHQLRSTSSEFTVHTSIDADSKFLLPAPQPAHLAAARVLQSVGPRSDFGDLALGRLGRE